MVDRLEQRGFEPVADVEHAVAAIGKSAWPVGADVGEWRHEVGGAVAADAPIDWNEVEIANRRHDARIGLLLGRDQQRPVGWISDVLEQVDRWKSTADDPDSTLPYNSRDWDVRRLERKGHRQNYSHLCATS